MLHKEKFHIKIFLFKNSKNIGSVAYLFWQQWKLRDVKVVIQHIELIKVLLLHPHSGFE
jgi:hypothetical protein